MTDYNYLPASDGTGDASLMHLTANRSIGSTTYVVDSVVGVPANFLGTCGTLLADGFIDPTTITNFKGHVSGATLIIDGFEPGSLDGGNTSGQVIVIKPTTGWSNRVAAFIKNATNWGTPENVTFNNVVAGGTLGVTGFSTLTGGFSNVTMTNPYKFSVTAGGGTYGTGYQTIRLGTKIIDDGNYSLSTFQYTIPVTGFYEFNGAVESLVVTGLLGNCQINSNNTTNVFPYTGTTWDNQSGSNQDMWGNCFTPPVQMNAGEVVYLQNTTSSGSTYTVVTANFGGKLISKL